MLADTPYPLARPRRARSLWAPSGGALGRGAFIASVLAVGCGGDDVPSGAGPSPGPPFEDGPLSHEIFTETPEPGVGLSTGEFDVAAVAYEPIEVDPKLDKVLCFQMSPMMPPSRIAIPTSGTLVLYDDAMNVVVFSPMDHFFESLIDFRDGRIEYGIEGEIDEIPEGMTHRFVMVQGTGIARTLAYWGEVLRADRGRPPVGRYADAGVSNLGYWTDNGAAYYYATEPGMNEEDTLLAVAADAVARNIPLRYVQLDSWWYFKAPGAAPNMPGGLVRWEPQPEMFPDGLAAFQQAIDLPLVLHNRWFAKDSDYAADYEFTFGEEMALPLSRDVYDRFMADAVSWGAVTYEQDWLMSQFWGVPYLRSGIGNAESWLAGIDAAASDAGLTMQLTMAGAAHLMSTVDRPAVTSIRTSIDYLAGFSKEAFWPQFHTVDMLAAGLGILPFKDTFQTSEPWGEAEALISALSAGMVGPSDAIGAMDAALLGRTCRSDGRLLKPDGPAVPVDGMFLEHERPYVTVAYSAREGLGRWAYVAAYHLASAHEERDLKHGAFAAIAYDGIPVEDQIVFPAVVRDWHVDLARDLRLDGEVVVYDWRAGTAELLTGSYSIPPILHLYDHAYAVVAPVLDNGLALVGETDKFVTMSDERFAAVAAEGDAIAVRVVGAPGETVSLVGYDARSRALLAPVALTVGADGSAEGRIARP